MVESNPNASFFVSGGTVPLGAASYVRREADRALLEALREGRYAYVLTSRQMGKSSLSVRTMEVLREEGVRTTFVDLTRVGGRNVTAEQWYAGLLGEVGRGLGDRAALLARWKAHAELGPMQRFFGALGEAAAESTEPVVVFIDEIDATKSLPFSTDEFFAGIRECFNRRVQDPAMARLSFCLIGVAIPSDLMSDAKLTPFNVGERIVLRDFSPAEAATLAQGLGAPLPPGGSSRGKGPGNGGHALVGRIVHWTGGHPFLTQSLGRRLVEEGARTTADVDRLVAEEFFEVRARETNINLADVGNRVLNSYDDPNAVAKYRSDILALYESVLKGRRVPDDESNRLVAVLKLSGLVKAEEGLLKVRNRVYARVFDAAWIEEHTPNQEIRRQQRAFRLGVVRASALATAMLLVVGSLGVVAAGNARRANLALDQVRKERDRSDTLAKQAQTERDRANGNAAQARSATLAANEAKRKAQGLAAATARALAGAQTQKRRADVQARLARSQTRIANEQQSEAERRRIQAVASAADAQRSEAEASRETRVANAQRTRAEDQSYESYANGIRAAGIAMDSGRADLARPILESLQGSLWRGWEYGHLISQSHEPASGSVQVNAVEAVGFALAGREIVAGDYLGKISVWSADSLAEARRFDAAPAGAPRIRSLVPIGSTEGVVSLSEGGRLTRYALGNGRTVWERSVGDKGANVVAIGGDLLATCAEAGRVRLWRLSDGAPIRSFALGKSPLGSVAFSPDGRILAAAGNGEVFLSNLDGQVLWSGPCVGRLNGVAFSADGRQIAAGGVGGLVRVWDVASGARRLEWKEDGDVNAIAASPKADVWAVAGAYGVCLRDGAAGVEAARHASDNKSGVLSLAFSPGGDCLALGGDQGIVTLWSLGSPRIAQTLEHRSDPRTGAAVRTVRQGLGPIEWVDACKQADLVVYAAHLAPLRSPGQKGVRLEALSLRDGAPRWVKDFPESEGIEYLSISPNGKRVAISVDRKVQILRTEDGNVLREIPGSYRPRYSPDGRWLSVLKRGGAEVWDARTDRRWGFVAAPGNLHCSTFSPDGSLLATGDGVGNIRLCDLARGTQALFPNDGGEMWTLAFSPDGKRLLAGSHAKTCVWEIAARRRTVLNNLEFSSGWVESAAFFPDGSRFATQGAQEVPSLRLWDARTNRELLAFRNSDKGRSMCVPDERTIVAGYNDGTLRVFEGPGSKVPPGLRLPAQDARRRQVGTMWVRSRGEFHAADRR